MAPNHPRLSSTLINNKSALPCNHDPSDSPPQPPFIVLCDNTYFLLVPWRKFILDSSRLQVAYSSKRPSCGVSPGTTGDNNLNLLFETTLLHLNALIKSLTLLGHIGWLHQILNTIERLSIVLFFFPPDVLNLYI